MIRRTIMVLAFLAVSAPIAWSKTHPAYRAIEKTGIGTYKNRREVGNTLFSLKPISHTARNPSATITEIEVPENVDDFKFYVRFYYPDSLGKIARSPLGKTRAVGAATEVWIDGEMVWRSSGELQKEDLDRITSSYFFDETVYGRDQILDAARKLGPGKSSLTVWTMVYYQERQPHPDTGVERYVDGRIFTSYGTIDLIKK
jgi:hypothetical protein